jgi:hypothetical protein
MLFLSFHISRVFAMYLYSFNFDLTVLEHGVYIDRVRNENQPIVSHRHADFCEKVVENRLAIGP